MLWTKSFHWTEEALEAFDQLKVAMTMTSILTLLDCTIPFVVECDVFNIGIGIVLQQHGHPIAYYSPALAPHHQQLPAYEKQLICLAKAICHWRPHLWGRLFIVHADHYSLEYFLDQQAVTSLNNIC